MGIKRSKKCGKEKAGLWSPKGLEGGERAEPGRIGWWRERGAWTGQRNGGDGGYNVGENGLKG